MIKGGPEDDAVLWILDKTYNPLSDALKLSSLGVS